MIREAEAILARVREKLARHRADHAELVQTIATEEAEEAKWVTFLEAARDLAARAPVPTPSGAPDFAKESQQTPSEQAARPMAPPPGRIKQPYGFWTTVVDTCVDMLRQRGKPMRTKALLEELEKNGVVFNVADPLVGLSNKLSKSRLLRRHDLLGWFLTEWPEPPPSQRNTVEQRLALLRALDQQQPTEQRDGEEKPFFGKSLGAAAVEVLKRHGKPMGVVAIAKVLADGGFPFTHKDHSAAVQGALKRRATGADSAQDVFRVSPGTYAMKIWYPPEVREVLEANPEGMPGRDKQAHLEATRAAVQAAKQNGVRFGALPKLSEEEMTRARRMITDGTHPKDVARAFGVSTTSVLKWVRKWEEQARTLN